MINYQIIGASQYFHASDYIIISKVTNYCMQNSLVFNKPILPNMQLLSLLTNCVNLFTKINLQLGVFDDLLKAFVRPLLKICLFPVSGRLKFFYDTNRPLEILCKLFFLMPINIFK